MLKVYKNSSLGVGKRPDELKYEYFKFPGGELHFNFNGSRDDLDDLDRVIIVAEIMGSDDIMLLCLMADYFECDVHLQLLYTPYARQDRKTSSTEPFSFKTFARIINSCGFKTVKVFDPHSDVTPALINNCKVVNRFLTSHSYINDVDIIVSPDAGAMKVNNEVCKHHHLDHIVATKVRDVQTGDITETQVHANSNLKGRRLLILDDICDGGKTFIELAKVLRKYEPASIGLFVTVGIYSKGIEVLEPYFDSINQFYKFDSSN